MKTYVQIPSTHVRKKSLEKPGLQPQSDGMWTQEDDWGLAGYLAESMFIDTGRVMALTSITRLCSCMHGLTRLCTYTIHPHIHAHTPMTKKSNIYEHNKVQ